MVTLIDPQGFPMNLFYGQTPVTPGTYPDKLIANYEVEKPRVRRFQRFQPGPAAVHKVSHSSLYHKDKRSYVLAWTLRRLHHRPPRTCRLLHAELQYRPNRLPLR